MGSTNHQAIYNQYVDPSQLVMKFTGVTSTPVGSTYTVALTLTLANAGQPYVDVLGVPSLLQKTFYAVQYNSTTRQWLNSQSMSAGKSAASCTTVCSSGVTPTATPGTYTLTVTGFAYDPTTAVAPFDGAEVYGYVAKDLLNVESYTPATHYQLYANMNSAALAFGTAQAADPGTYASNADVSACTAATAPPYRKHGYREAVVVMGSRSHDWRRSGSARPSCPARPATYDNRAGSDAGWQQEVTTPRLGPPASRRREPTYAYTTTLMNDVHMSHAMEFPYPQSMANCVTCHEGKLDKLADGRQLQGLDLQELPPGDGNSPAYPTRRAGRRWRLRH